MSEGEFVNILLTSTRENDILTLENHLLTISNANDYLNRIFIENTKQKCTLLAIACLKGYIELIDMLLTRFTPDLEVLNDITLGDEHINQPIFSNVSVLWIAASINNFAIVKLLVEHGANVNHRTKTHSTPLRGACFNGNLDMIRYLIDKGADIHITKENNDTNLMVSVCHKHWNVIMYLVHDLKVDVNKCDNDGRSALYDAVNSGSLEIVEFLLKNGARNFRANKDRMSPLLWAAEKRRVDLVTTISYYCELIERIEAEELIGSSFICASQRDRHIDRAFEHFRRALELRIEHHFPKQLRLKSNDIFHNQEECQTLDELQQIEFNFDRMYIEALLIRERLLGVNNEEYHYSLCYRGAILADSGQDHEGLQYWIYELHLCQQNKIQFDAKHLRHFISLFSRMLHHKKKMIPMDSLFTILVAITDELNTNEEKYFNDNLYNLLFLVTVISQIFIMNKEISSTDRIRFIRYLHLINQRNYVLLDSKKSLLHLSLDNKIIVNDYNIKHICKYNYFVY